MKEENCNWLSKNISLQLILNISILIITMVYFFANIGAGVSALERKVNTKADKVLVMTIVTDIKKSIDEIKIDIRELRN